MRVIAVVVCGLALPWLAAAAQVGSVLPAAEVYGSDDTVLALDQLRDGMTVITYETREVVPDNDRFKKAVFALDPGPRIVAIVDCSGYPWPIRRLCERSVRRHARDLTIPLYVDRSGAVRSALALPDGCSSVVIADPQGRIRYCFSGVMSEREVARALAIIAVPPSVPTAPSRQ